MGHRGLTKDINGTEEIGERTVECSCVYVENDGDVCAFERHKIVKAKKAHKCSECGTSISAGEKYEYSAGKWDGEIFVNKTCQTCLDIRKVIFCNGFCYGAIMVDLREHIIEMDCDISENFLSEMSPAARERVCKIIEDCWERKHKYD